MSELRSRFFRAKRYLDKPRLVVAVAAAGILIFSLLLAYEFRKKFRKLENEIVGYVNYKSNAVKRKMESTAVWDDLDANEVLAQRDTVRSDAASIALLSIEDETEIRMDEESMILLDIKGKNKSVDLLKGSVFVKKKFGRGSFIELNSGELKVSLQEGEFSLSRKDNGGLEIFVTKGSALMQKGKKEYTLKESFFAFFGKAAAEPETAEAYAVLTSPERMKFFVSDRDSMEVPFSWNSKEEAVRIQISAKSDFSILYRENIVQGKAFKGEFPVGSYYWRIVPLNPKSASRSPVGKFTVMKDQVFQCRFPNKDSVFLFHDRPVLVNFAWDRLPDIKDYILEISKSANFENLHKRLEVSANIVGLDFSEEGSYYYRVKTVLKNKDFPEKLSDIGSFSVKKRTGMRPPELLSPPNGQVMEFSEKTLLGWEADSAYTGYSLLLAENRELNQGLKRIVTKNNYAVMEKLKPGTDFFWKVDGMSSDGKTVSSELRNFRIQDKKNEIIPVKTAVPDVPKKEPEKTAKNEPQKAAEVKPSEPEKQKTGLNAPKSKKNSEVKYEEDGN